MTEKKPRRSRASDASAVKKAETPTPVAERARRRPLDGVRLASGFKVKAVEWLWFPYLPKGKVVIFDGDPGRGKSMVLLSIVAHIALGIPLPGSLRVTKPKPQGCVVIAAEDDWEDTVVPRLIAAIHTLKPKISKAEVNRALDRIATLDVERDDEGNIVPFVLPRDSSRILDAIDSVGAAFVAVDPIMAFLGEDTNSGVDQSVRTALSPLKELAMDNGVSFVLLRHLNKDTKTKAEYRGGGSHGGFVGLARGQWMAEFHPDKDEHPGEVVLVHAKSNLSERGRSLTYTIEGYAFRDDDGNTGETSLIRWGDVIDMDAATLMRGPDSRKSAPARRECMAAIESLMEERDPYPASEIQKLLKADGHKDDTIKNAKRDLGVRSVKDYDADTGKVLGWAWTLKPEDEAGGEE